MLTIGRLVAVLLHVPGKDANLVVVVRRAITRLCEKTDVLRYFLVSVLNFIQNEKCDLTRTPSCYLSQKFEEWTRQLQTAQGNPALIERETKTHRQY